VLKKDLQDHKKIRKWSDRTGIGINLGYSSRHALNFSLIFILQTGSLSICLKSKTENLRDVLSRVSIIMPNGIGISNFIEQHHSLK